MFNINVYWIIGLTVAFLLGGIILAIAVNFWYALPLLIIGLILLAIYILFGSVNNAAQHIQNEDFDAAEKTLKLTWKPEWLYVSQRAVYYIMTGAIAMSRKDMKGAEAEFNKAMELDLPTDNERGMVLIQLANINAQRGNWQAAKRYHREASKLDLSEPAFKMQLDQLNQAIKQSGQIKLARSMGKQGMQMMNRGGGKSKRRRPRVR